MEEIENKSVAENMTGLRNHILPSSLVLLASTFLFLMPEILVNNDANNNDITITVFFITYAVAFSYFLFVRLGLKNTQEHFPMMFLRFYFSSLVPIRSIEKCQFSWKR